jgi:hypothetical protein
VTSLEENGKFVQVNNFPTEEKKQMVRDDVKITPDASGHQTVLYTVMVNYTTVSRIYHLTRSDTRSDETHSRSD